MNFVEIEGRKTDFLNPRHLGGGARFRTIETEDRYRTRYRWLHRRATQALENRVGPYRLAIYVASLAPTLRSSAYRQYTAAIMQMFRDLANHGRLDVKRASEAAAMLREAEKTYRSGNNRKGKPDRGGSGRAKSMTVEESKKLIKACAEKKPRRPGLSPIFWLLDL